MVALNHRHAAHIEVEKLTSAIHHTHVITLLNEFIDDSMKVYSSEWSVVRREFPIDGSREKNLGRIRV